MNTRFALQPIWSNCFIPALYSLNIECCCITTRTIQKLCDALDSNIILSHLSIVYNNPISGHTIVILLAKLLALKRFSKLNLSGLKLNKPAIDGVCKFLKSSSLSGLFLRATNIGCDEASQLTDGLLFGTQELLKLDLSCCGLTSRYLERLKTYVTAFAGIMELNLGGNSFGSEGGSALASVLMNSSCCIKVLTVNKFFLSLSRIINIINALSENDSVEELDLGENVTQEDRESLHCQSTSKYSLPPTEEQWPKHDVDAMYEDELQAYKLMIVMTRQSCLNLLPLESVSHALIRGH